jgi:hypothetical protein
LAAGVYAVRQVLKAAPVPARSKLAISVWVFLAKEITAAPGLLRAMLPVVVVVVPVQLEVTRPTTQPVEMVATVAQTQ